MLPAAHLVINQQLMGEARRRQPTARARYAGAAAASLAVPFSFVTFIRTRIHAHRPS